MYTHLYNPQQTNPLTTKPPDRVLTPPPHQPQVVKSRLAKTIANKASFLTAIQAMDSRPLFFAKALN